jgi:hypothetical protein
VESLVQLHDGVSSGHQSQTLLGKKSRSRKQTRPARLGRARPGSYAEEMDRDEDSIDVMKEEVKVEEEEEEGGEEDDMLDEYDDEKEEEEKRDKRWRVRCWDKAQNKGYFATEEDAARAYQDYVEHDIVKYTTRADAPQHRKSLNAANESNAATATAAAPEETADQHLTQHLPPTAAQDTHEEPGAIVLDDDSEGDVPLFARARQLVSEGAGKIALDDSSSDDEPEWMKSFKSPQEIMDNLDDEDEDDDDVELVTSPRKQIEMTSTPAEMRLVKSPPAGAADAKEEEVEEVVEEESLRTHTEV